MRIAVDTSILVRYTNRDDDSFTHVHTRVAELDEQEHDLCIAPQSVYEYWAVATRPVKVNGLGLTTDAAEQTTQRPLRAFTLIADPPDLLDRWLYLCIRHEVRGRASHDARIAAWMGGNGIGQLYTLNPRDFARFAEIQLVEA